MRNVYEDQLGNLKGRDHLEDLDVDVSIVSKRILKKYGVMVWSGFKSPVAGSCEHGIETSDSIIGEYF
jgi:hypothetical protein